MALMRIATFSIVAHDPESEEWGVAVASKFLAAASVVPWARAKVGAIATQALANIGYGPDGLEQLSEGRSAQDVIAALTAADDDAENRQVGIVDSKGRAATFTGTSCFDWAGGIAGDGYCVQGNILTGPEVVEAMKEAFVSTPGDLADRMLEALIAGDRAGGDSRGRQSAGILVAKEGGSYGGFTDKALDLRVDDHPDPVPELHRLRGLHRLYLEKPSPDDLVDLTDELILEIKEGLAGLGFLEGDENGFGEATQKALQGFMGIENLEMRWADDERVDRHVLRFLRDKAAGVGS
jgi:uncharacterized Ntn-hydrolase superfamily protein